MSQAPERLDFLHMQQLCDCIDVPGLLDAMEAHRAALPSEQRRVWGRLVAATRALQQALVPPPSADSAVSPSRDMPDSFALPQALQMLWDQWRWLRPPGASPPHERVERESNAALLLLQRAMALLTAEAGLAAAVGDHLQGSLRQHLKMVIAGLPARRDQWDPSEERLVQEPEPRFQQYTGPPQASTLLAESRPRAASTLTYAAPPSQLDQWYQSVKDAISSQQP